MQQNKDLDYETLYYGKGEQILDLIKQHYGDNYQLLSKSEIAPDRPERDNKVGVKYKILIHNKYLIMCSVNLGVALMIESIEKQKVYISEVKYMTWDKLEKMSFKYDDEIVLEKLEILDNVIESLEKGEEIKRVDIEK